MPVMHIHTTMLACAEDSAMAVPLPEAIACATDVAVPFWSSMRRAFAEESLRAVPLASATAVALAVAFCSSMRCDCTPPQSRHGSTVSRREWIMVAVKSCPKHKSAWRYSSLRGAPAAAYSRQRQSN